MIARTRRYRPGRDRRAVFHPPRPPRGERVDPATRHVAVVGGGIAGLTAALGLAERGIQVTLLEREATLGGRVRSWPTPALEGAHMSRGFHAFFRQYYNLRAMLRRADPTLASLQALDDYPLTRAGGQDDSFAGIPRTPPWNLVEFVRRSPSFDLTGLRQVDVEQALGLLDVHFGPDGQGTYSSLDGVSAAEVLDRLRFPDGARHLALEVFARSFFADPRDFSGAELVAMFHLYFVGSAEGLLFDVPRDDYDSTLWRPFADHLARLGVQTRTEVRVDAVADAGEGVRVRGTSADGEPLDVAADAVVLALDPISLRELVARSATLAGGPTSHAGAAWRRQVAGVRSAPPFAVWRLWLDGPVRDDRAPFLGASGYGPVDNISVLERFEEHAARYRRERGGSVVEVHAYALADDCDPADHADALREDLREHLHRIYPETAGLGVVHEEWLVERDCVLVGLEPWASRPGVETPDPRVRLCGDAIRCDLPVALMERAATTGWQAADSLLSGWGLHGHGVWSAPVDSRLGPAPALLRRAIRAGRRVTGRGQTLRRTS